nr:hypothetical protein [Candidatus Sigynarchaeum springense]
MGGWILTTTTITIDNETRDHLLRIAAELQARLKRKISYNDAIKYLLQQKPSRQVNVQKFKAACEQMPGVDTRQMIEVLHRERKHDDK